MRYRSNLPYALCNVSFRIEPGDRVAVMGRTGKLNEHEAYCDMDARLIQERESRV
jgi:hypothetical protein